ncbi:hypothetical protein KIH23_00800 [Flavobacterium sp. CYK-55]|uniref:hypothetical protein n=1 Tax=Flavobacterium sp. CYK-55 TaxID=2835529 RepID=UPI001BCDFF34|nr:hypothetical protein [Flavobacterium sp. CYK-55]MBS7785820.1 hypothetical protein [Flavobacterium sp. CYK-55]
MKTRFLMMGAVLTLMVTACSKDDSKSSASAADFSADEAKLNSKMDIANDDVSDIVEAQFDATQSSAAGRSAESSALTSNLPSCATVTRIPAFGETITPGTQVTKTIDFGTTGCTMNNGNILKGKIIITFTYQPGANPQTINYQFDNFYHNAVKFTGNKTFTRTMTDATATSPSHPVVVMNMDLDATFPDGRVIHRTGTRTREIIEGYGNGDLSDNVYSVTGNWTNTFPNASVKTSTITTPLIVKMSCIQQNKPLIVQGVITFQRNTRTATLDYGDGECDNIATYTVNGNSYTIIIGN